MYMMKEKNKQTDVILDVMIEKVIATDVFCEDYTI